MTLRALFALFLLTNYLLLAVMGHLSRPEDGSYMLIIKSASDQTQRYEECRYMRMDGIEAFMAEALATHYQEKTNNNDHMFISMVNAVDAHFLPDHHQIFVGQLLQQEIKRHGYKLIPSKDIALAIDLPPEFFHLA